MIVKLYVIDCQIIMCAFVEYIATALVNHLMSVSHADDAEDESDRTHLMETNIAGFLVVYTQRNFNDLIVKILFY